jgi:sugar-specific transcriptional regulator TrmB
MKYATQLQKLGFTENEAYVYLANLRVGNARVSRIAEEANLPKSTTNDTLESLLAKGLVSRYQHKNRFHFSATDPDVLTTWLERKQSLLGELLPKLHATQRSAGAQPSIRSYFDIINQPLKYPLPMLY